MDSSSSSPSLVSTPQLVAVSSLFWPEFIEFRGCVVLAVNTSQAGLQKWWDDTSGDREKIQAALNHAHLYDFVVYEEQTDVRLAALEGVAERIADGWRPRLAALYPERRADVVVTSEPDDYGPTVSFSFLGR
jgi:hypothetical protein